MTITAEESRTQSRPTPAPTTTAVTLDAGIERFVRSLAGRNLSEHTISAYRTDLRQFVDWLRATDVSVTGVEHVTRALVTEFLGHLADEGRSGVTRARKLASIRECFRFLVEIDVIPSSPAAGIAMPRKEKKQRVYLRVDEYTRMLSAAGTNPRDYAILQMFLQTGVRISELVNLRVGDVDLDGRVVRVVAGKGNKDREIQLEKKVLQALKNYLRLRTTSYDDHLFLNYQGEGLSIAGVKKIVQKYRVAAGITKQISAHSLRHTFASYKASRGVSPFQLKEWLGHTSITTTQIYVHDAARDGAKVMEATSL